MWRSSAAAWSGRAWRWRLRIRALRVLSIEAHAPDERPAAQLRRSHHGARQRRAPHSRHARRLAGHRRRGRCRSAAFTSRTRATSASARLEASEHELDAFGYTVSNRHIGAVLWRLLRTRARITLRLSRASARAAARRRCGAAATGRCQRRASARSAPHWWSRPTAPTRWSRRPPALLESSSDYEQVALVANIRTDRPSRGIAYRALCARRADGTAAAVGRAAITVVWALAPARAAAHAGLRARRVLRPAAAALRLARGQDSRGRSARRLPARRWCVRSSNARRAWR